MWIRCIARAPRTSDLATTHDGRLFEVQAVNRDGILARSVADNSLYTLPRGSLVTVAAEQASEIRKSR